MIDTLPVEIETIRKSIVGLGVQDQIIIDGRPADTGRIRGVFHRYTTRDGLYGEPIRTTLIGYNTNLDLAWQRLACCKELMHVFDDPIEETKTQDELQTLIDKLLGPMSTDDIGVADLMAHADRIATYRCLSILLPEASRLVCRESINLGKSTLVQVAAAACIPELYARFVLRDDWPEVLRVLLGSSD